MDYSDSELFLQKVVSCPNEINWKNPCDVQLLKLTDDSFGVVLKTCSIPRVKETWTVVISVKERCQFVNSCTLDCGFRVTKINGYDITKSNSAEVGKILKSCKNKKGIVTLRVYEPYSVPSLDAHVESQKLLNPLLNNSNSSSISSVSGISQSEDIKLESLSKDHRRKKNQSQLQVKSSKTSGSHSWYTTQSSNLSLGSDLTPVETPETPISGGCTETTPLMAFSHVGGPSSLGSDAENVDVGKAALQNPCNIKWQINTEKITLQKTGKDDKVGFYYKIKKTSNDSELYFLVEKVDVGSPSHGKLHIGDWIRSVNGTPITDNKDLLKQEIKKSTREVTLVIQRPESILRPTSAIHNNNSKKKRENQHVKPSHLPQDVMPSILVSEKNCMEPSSNETRFFSEVNVTALDDIKIDGMSVYKGPVPHDSATEPAIVITEQNDTTIDSFITGREITPNISPRHSDIRIPATVCAYSSHRRNNSESSVAVLSKCLSDTPGVTNTRPAISTSEEEVSDLNSGMIAECIKHIARRDLQRKPYVRINQISTRSNPHSNLTTKLLKALGVEGNMLCMTSHVLQVSRKCAEAVGSRYSRRMKVGDFIIAKLLTESFKCRNASLPQVKKALLSCENKLLTGSGPLIENFMQKTPALDSEFVEVEVESLVYEDILNFWPSVYFTANSVYMLIFDYQLLVSQTEDEIKRLQMCINFIHSSSSTSKIYLLCNNYPMGGRLDTIMKMLSPLESALTVSNLDFTRCSNCGCDKSKVAPDALSQLQENKHSGQLYYLANRPQDWEAFVHNIQDHLFSASKFPVSAVLAKKLLDQEESESMATTTMTYFKQNILHKILPGLSEREALTALHQSGKVCWHSQVPHRTVHSNAHNMFILLRPIAIKESVQCIQSQVRNTVSSLGLRVTHQQVLNNCLSLLKYKDKEEVTMFLELYHILEAVKSGEPQSEYYIVPQLMEPAANLPALVKRYISGKSHQIVFVDFHGLLPVNMCLSLLARLGEVFGGSSQIKSVCTGSFEYQGMSLLVQLVPYQGKAVILITFDQSATVRSMEVVFQLLSGALKKAVSSNLLTYHIGLGCREHYTDLEIASLLTEAEFTTLTQKVHVLDATEQVTMTGLNQTSWKHGVNGLCIDMNTFLEDIPAHVEDILCKGLNFGGGWKYLFESVGLADWKMEDEFGRSENPTKLLLAYLKTSSTCTMRDVVKLLQKRQRNDILQDLMDLGVSCVL